MPILYVNPSGPVGSRANRRFRTPGTRPGMGVGRASSFSRPISFYSSPGRMARQPSRMQSAFAKRRKAAGLPGGTLRSNPARKRKKRIGIDGNIWSFRGPSRKRKKSSPQLKRRRKARRAASPVKKRKITTMAKRRKRKSSRRRARRAVAAAPKRRRKRRVKSAAPKRRRRKRKAAAAPKRRRRKRKSSSRRRKARRPRRSRRARAARKGHRRRKRYGTGNFKHRLRKKGAYGPVFRRSKVGRARRGTVAKSLMLNPPRRRRRGARRRSRRVHRRMRRNGYRRNPGGMLIDLAKRALPVFGAFLGAKFLSGKLAQYIPGISSLGGFAGPAVAVGTVVAIHYGSKHVGFLAKHKNELMLGAGIAAAESLFRAFAPQSVKDAIGLGEYVGVGDDIYSRGLSEYVGVGADPLDDDIAMNGYIQVGAEEALGLDEELGGAMEELGVDEELGGLIGGGMPGGLSTTALQRQIPTQSFSRAIPARSFTRQIPHATGNFDNPQQLYVGVFGGGFGN